MGIRETLNEKPAAAVIGILMVVVVAGVVGWKSYPRTPRGIVGLGKAFYTIDDGKTWFVDEATNIPPYTYDGRTAYQVQVFECSHGGKFVAFMQSYSPANKAKLEKAIADGQSGTDLRGMEAILGALVKKPGDAEWVKNTDPNYDQVVRLSCPDGTGDGLEKVDPND